MNKRYERVANELLRRSQLRAELAELIPPMDPEQRKELEARVRSAKHSLRWNVRRSR